MEIRTAYWRLTDRLISTEEALKIFLSRKEEKSPFAEFGIRSNPNKAILEQSIAGIWFALESYIYDSAVEILMNRGVAHANEEMRKLVENHNASEKNEVFFQMIVKEYVRKSRCKNTLESFEALYRAVGMPIDIDEELRAHSFPEKINELHQVRNSIVHKAGIVDKSFKDKCPSYPIDIGGQVIISYEKFTEYHCLAILYSVLTLQSRTKALQISANQGNKLELKVL